MGWVRGRGADGAGRAQAGMPGRRAAARRAGRSLRRLVAGVLGPVLAAGSSVVPVAFTVSAAVGVSAAGVVVSAAPARASAGSVLILSTSVNGGTASAEAAAAVAAGATVTVKTPAQWDALTTAQFGGYSAIIIGDPGTTSCATSVPSDALSTAATWGAAVTGNVAVLGTAPALAGSAGAALLSDAVSYALAGSGTGLYVSLNCAYSSAAAGTPVPLLAGVDGGGFTVTGRGSGCPDSGTVNTWEADALPAFTGLKNTSLASWASPACSAAESFTAWPAALSGVAYLAGASPADFTASDGAAGQPYVLAGVPASAGTQALAPSAGGEVPGQSTAGGTNAAAPGVAHAMAGDPVDTETGDFTQSATDLSVPGFGPSLGFTRTYDAATAQQETQAGAPGALGYGWTDNWASSLTTGNPVPGNVYAVDGLATDTGQGGPAAGAAINHPDGVFRNSTGTYIADTSGNRIEEIPATSGTQWGQPMTAGDIYTIVGTDYGEQGDSGNGTAAGSFLLNGPEGVTIDQAGNLFIADSGNDRVAEVPAASGTQWGGLPVTAGDGYTIAGVAGQAGLGADSRTAITSDLDEPGAVAVMPSGGPSDGSLLIADAGNNRIQEVAATSATRWGQSMTAGDVYTVAGTAAGTLGHAGDGGAAKLAELDSPEDVQLSTAGDMYIADTGNNRVQEVPAAGGTQWAHISMTAGDMYTIAGGATGTAGTSGAGGVATSALLTQPIGLWSGNGQQLYIAGWGSDTVQEIARTGHTEWGQSMTAGDLYTVAGTAGDAGHSGDGGAATAAVLNTPGDVTMDSSGNLIIADTGSNEVREVAASTGVIFDLAGSGSFRQDGDGGPSTMAGLDNPGFVIFDSAGDLFIADTGSNRVQEIAARTHAQFGVAMTAGDVYTVAGQQAGWAGSSGDGGPATAAYLDEPEAVAVDGSGNLFIADTANYRIREVAAATGHISTVAGGTAGNSGDGGPAASAALEWPDALAVDGAGDLYVTDAGAHQVREIAAAAGSQWGQSMTAGDIYTIAGSTAGTAGTAGDGGPAAAALLNTPEGITISPAGDVYIADSNNNRIQEIAATASVQWGQSMTAGDIYTVAGSATGTAGNSGDTGPATAARLDQPQMIAIGPGGDLDIADSVNNRIREVAYASGTQWSQQMTAGNIYNIAGLPAGTPGETGDGGPATTATLDGPVGLAVDQDGNLYIADLNGGELREVTATTATPFPLSPQADAIDITQPDGSRITFYPKAGGTCTTPYVLAGSYCALPQYTGATLAYNSGTEVWTYGPSPGTTYTYAWDGALTSETDAAGDTLTISYDTPAPGTGHCPTAAATCATVTAASGRALVIGSNSAGLVTSVTDPLGRQWTYGYNTASDLTSATDPMGQVTTYTYGAGPVGGLALASDLLTITAPNAQPSGPDGGDATVNTYDAYGRVTAQTDPMGYQTTFNYCVNAADGDCLDTATGTGYVTVTDPDGNATVYDYQQGTLAAQADYTGTTLTAETDNVPDTTAGGTSGGTLLDTTTADADGNITTTTYDPAGNLTSTTAPDGIGTLTGTTTDWSTALDSTSCATTAQASSICSSSQEGPSPVAPGGLINPPPSAPPQGATYTLYDTDGSQLYTTIGVYEPGATSAAYLQTTYQLFTGNSVTLGSTNITCTYTPPAQSLPCATINADGVVTQLQYDAQGDVTSSSTPDGNGSQLATTTYAYNGNGEQTGTTSPDGNVSGANAGNYTTTTAFNGDGQKTSVTDGDGNGYTVTPRTTSYGYDADGNQTTVKGARGFTTTTAYNSGDKPALVTNPDGNATLTCYDGDGNAAQTVPPVGVAASSLTPASCPTSYPSGYSDRLASDATASTFNALGKLTQKTTPPPAGQSGYATTNYSYDGNGDLTKITAPAASNGGQNQVTTDTYNAAVQLAAQTTGSGTVAASTVSYCHDPNGDSTAVVYGDGNTSTVANCETSSPWVVSSSGYPTQAASQTTYSYDSTGELVATTTPPTSAAPSGATTTSTYDPVGNMLTRTDPDGVTTTWTYTPLNLTASITYSGSSAHSVTYTYDANEQKTAMTDATGSSAYVWDVFGELASAADGVGQTVGYAYNADGSVTGVAYPLPSTVTWASTDTVGYGYDNADVMTSITDFNGHQITITPNADSLAASETLGSSGDTITSTYDPTDALSVRTLKNSSSALQSFTYSDAPAGQILSETDAPSSSQSPATYTYDTKGRVTSMTPGTGSALNYGFDASSNLTTLPTGATGTYDQDGELTSSAVSGTTTTYAYSADGERLTAKQSGSTVASGTWNGAGELATYSDPAASMTDVTYDGTGLRAAATVGSVTQTFTWNTIGSVPLLLMDSANAYLYGASGTPAEQVNLSTGTIIYLVADSLGSVRGTVGATGALTQTTSYSAWGDPETTGGLTASTPFGYAGGYTDPSGLLYLVNRYYDPATGQFISVDPQLSQTLAPYSYADGNPVSNTDPSGRWWEWDGYYAAFWESWYYLGPCNSGYFCHNLDNFISAIEGLSPLNVHIVGIWTRWRVENLGYRWVGRGEGCGWQYWGSWGCGKHELLIAQQQEMRVEAGRIQAIIPTPASSSISW